MNFNEWAKYSGIGSTCEYDDRTMQFIEQYNNATFQTYMDNERKNRAIQRADQIRAQRGEILSANSKRSNGAVPVHQGRDHQEVHPKMFRWKGLVMDKLRQCVRKFTKGF